MIKTFKRYNRYILFLLFILSSFFITLSSVNADFGTHLNVSIYEVVYQETTFAENFTLTEWQKYCYSEGIVNVTNPNNETVYDVYISFSNTGGLSTNFTHDVATKFGNQTSGSPGSTIVLYIPELRQYNYTIFTYNISCVGNPSLDVDTFYSNSEHGFNRKVLAGHNWTVNQTVKNSNPINLTISNINVTIQASNVTWNNSIFNFSLQTLDAVGDYTNVSGNGTSNSIWYWSPNGGTLDWKENVSIRYNVRAPFSVPFTATYQAIKERISFNVNYLLSNLTIVDINASAKVDFNFEKRISQPTDNANNHNVTWEINPQVSVPVNITYNLNRVTLWVTENMDPSNDTASTPWGLLEVNHTGSPLKEINISTSWGNSSYYWYFNYTDGSNATNPPPIVWMEPEWLITHKYGQIVNFTQSVDGENYYLKYIYVVNGYWLEVAKNITNIADDQYRINIYVENIGNGWTPEFEYVTVYDYVPDAFGVWNMSQGGCPSTQCTNLTVGTSGDKYYGMSYRWNIPWKGTMNSSLGPKFGPDATLPSNYSWNVTYIVNGTGPYRVTELYVVGLDPLKVDGAHTSPIITIISGLQSHTNEIIYLAIIMFLVIVNIANLVMTNRIHKKLQDRLPPIPPPSAHHNQNHHSYNQFRPPMR